MRRGGPAHKGKNHLATLAPQQGESPAELLTRLDLAIARAQTDDIFTDETNAVIRSIKRIPRLTLNDEVCCSYDKDASGLNLFPYGLAPHHKRSFSACRHSVQTAFKSRLLAPGASEGESAGRADPKRGLRSRAVTDSSHG